jgi:hypothetical protein
LLSIDNAGKANSKELIKMAIINLIIDIPSIQKQTNNLKILQPSIKMSKPETDGKLYAWELFNKKNIL